MGDNRNYTQLEFRQRFYSWTNLVTWIEKNPDETLAIEGVRLSRGTLQRIVLLYKIFREPCYPERYPKGGTRHFSDEELLAISLRLDAGEQSKWIALDFGVHHGYFWEPLKKYKAEMALKIIKNIEAGKTTLAEIQKRRNAGLG